MSVSRRLTGSLLALCLGAGSAWLVACGDDSALLPANEADALLTRIGQVKSAINGGECESAASAAVKLQADARRLPSSVDRRLRQRIREGADKLAEEVPEDCTATPAQTTDTTTLPDTVTETTPTVTTTTTPTETTPPTTTQPTQTETTPTTTDPTQTDPGGTGGASDDGSGGTG